MVVFLSDDIICSPSALTSSLRYDVLVIVISTKFTTFIKLCEKWPLLKICETSSYVVNSISLMGIAY